MNAKCYCTGWPAMVALVTSVVALPGFADTLTLEQALRLAETQAPSLAAQDANLQAATHAAIPAGELPDPTLIAGLQNYPINGPNRWSIDDDFMTMRMIGIRQQVPNRDKREARVEVANATVERAAAERQIERLNVRQSTAMAWISSYSVERRNELFQALYKENRLLSETVRAQIAGGRAQPADAVSPKQEAALLEQQQDDLDLRRTQARAALKRWIGPAGDDEPVGHWPDWPIDSPGYSRQLEHHPALAAFTPMTREAEARVQEAISEKRSDWGWEVAYQHRNRQFGDMVSVQFSWDLPLFPGTRQNPKIAARQAELSQLQAQRETSIRTYGEQLESEVADYTRLDRAVQRSRERLVPLAEQKVELTLASYRAGKGDVNTVIAARRELIETRIRQIDMEEQRAQASARLYFAYSEQRP